MIRIGVIMLLLAGHGLFARVTKLNIHDAIHQKKIKAEVKSLGGHAGYCLKLLVRNLTRDSLIVLVEAGRRFVAGDSEDQDILIVKEQLLVLTKGQSKVTQLKGYCCESSDLSPSKGADYRVGKLAEPALYALAQRLNARALDRDTEQMAIWAISDRKLTSAIPVGADTSARELRKFVAMLKNEPVPWYNLSVRTWVHKNGMIEHFNTHVSGVLQFSNREVCYGTFSVVDTSGREVAFLKSGWLQAGDKQDYSFVVPVGGLKKGKYFVQVISNGGTLGKREFEI